MVLFRHPQKKYYNGIWEDMMPVTSLGPVYGRAEALSTRTLDEDLARPRVA
jgi:hypothetical protein